MKNIITIQHKQAVHHTNGMMGSWTDWELTDLGKAHAENIGRKLSDELKGQSWTIYSSDLIRARQTAEPLSDDTQFRGAETLRELWNRVVELCGEIIADEAENIILVSHGGTLRVLLAIWLDSEISEFIRFGSPGGVSFMEVNDNGVGMIAVDIPISTQ